MSNRKSTFLILTTILATQLGCNLFDDKQGYTGTLLEGTEQSTPRGHSPLGSLLGKPEFSSDGADIFYNEFRQNGYYTGSNRIRFNLSSSEKENLYYGDADLSPDESQLAYSLNGNLWIRRIDRSDSLRVTADGTDSRPVWSPDGGKLAFRRSAPNGCDVQNQSCGAFVIDLSTREMKRVILGGSLQWHPNGDKILTVRSGSKLVLSITRINDSAVVQEINLDHHEFPVFKFSPDGTKIAYHTYREGIWLMEENGSSRRLLVKTDHEIGGDGYFMYPSWHPFKNQLIVERYQITWREHNESGVYRGGSPYEEGVYGLYLIDIDAALVLNY